MKTKRKCVHSHKVSVSQPVFHWLVRNGVQIFELGIFDGFGDTLFHLFFNFNEGWAFGIQWIII